MQNAIKKPKLHIKNGNVLIAHIMKLKKNVRRQMVFNTNVESEVSDNPLLFVEFKN